MFKEKVDDYGTLFYKLRNGNLPFEYDTNKAIKEINKSIKNKDLDLYSVLGSAIITVCSNHFYSYSLWTNILVIIFSFLVLEGLVSGIALLREKIENRKNNYDKISIIEDEELQDLFYRKILVQTTYVYSVVKRIKELSSNNEEQNLEILGEKNSKKENNIIDFESKKELIQIYSMQGVYGIRKISVEFGEFFKSKNEDSKSYYVCSIGLQNVKKTLDILESSLNCFKEYYPECVKEADTLRIQTLMEEYKRIKDEQEKSNKKNDNKNDGNNKNNKNGLGGEKDKNNIYIENVSIENNPIITQQIPYKHIRTHIIPNNKAIYRKRKKRKKRKSSFSIK